MRQATAIQDGKEEGGLDVGQGRFEWGEVISSGRALLTGWAYGTTTPTQR